MMPALILALLATLAIDRHAVNDHWLDPYRQPASRIIATATADDAAWQRLALMTDTFGPRPSGSPGLEATIRWAAGEMKTDFDEVRLDPVMVPRWVRGGESLEIVSPHPSPLVMLGLGNSVGTGGAPIEAEVVVVRSFADLDVNAARVKGRIVLFNVPYTTYGETVQYRAGGPSRAAAHGAVAVLVRAVGPPGLRTPHTGALRYAPDRPRIP
ncbi:MAG: peptidase M28 family protein, partial [Vicinamibacterales bacterium]